jgi:hypothetical protein
MAKESSLEPSDESLGYFRNVPDGTRRIFVAQAWAAGAAATYQVPVFAAGTACPTAGFAEARRRAIAFRQLGQAEAAAGDVCGALIWARSQSSPLLKVRGLVGVVVLLVTKDDPQLVFDWVTHNVPQGDLIRQIARRVGYEYAKSPALDPVRRGGFGWFVKIVVRSRESVDRIVETWKPRVGRCDVVDFDRNIRESFWYQRQKRSDPASNG